MIQGVPSAVLVVLVLLVGLTFVTVRTSFGRHIYAVGTGRVENDARFAEWLTADDVAHAITTVLHQPRSVRTTLWALWSMGQQS